MKALLILLFLIFVIPQVPASAQQSQPGIAWKLPFGNKKNERATDLSITLDGKIALAGTTNSEPAQGTDALWLLLDLDGKKLKEARIGGKGNDVANAIAATDDGGFVLAGKSNSSPLSPSGGGGGGGNDGWLVKLNENGDTLWQKFIGTPRQEFFNDVIQTADGGILAVGSAERSEGKTDMWAYKTYSDGSLQWQQYFGNRGADEARAVTEDAQGNVALAGITSQGKGSRNVWLFILDKNGKPLRHHLFGARQFEEIHSIVATKDGGFALCGFAKAGDDGSGLKDAWLIKTAPDGEMLWQSTFGGRSNDSAFGMTETTDGGLVLVGYTFSHLMGANTSNALIVKADANGKEVWKIESQGGKSNDELSAVALLPDGSFVMAGMTSSKDENAQEEDAWVMRYNREFDLNTVIPTQLAISNAKLSDNGDGYLEEGEEAFLSMTIENKGRQDAYDIDIVAQEMTGVKALAFRNYRKLGFLAAGQSRLVRLPVKGLEGLELGDAVFQVFATDASRSRTSPLEVKVPTKPLNLPSEFVDIKWIDPPRGENGRATVKSPVISIRLKTRSDKKLTRSHFTILLNGQPYNAGQKAGEAGLADKGKVRQIFTYEYVSQIRLNPGVNRVEVVVDNGSKKATSEALEIEFSDKPNIHVLAIGIEHDDLKFTAKDAEDFANSFKNQDGRVFDKVYLTTLVSGARTKAGVFQTEGGMVKKAFRDLKEHYQYTIYEQDLLVVFLSSHGKTVNQDFKIIPTDFSMAGESCLIDYRQDVVEQLAPLPCRKLVFIDACHSGSFENSTANTGEAKPAGTTANSASKTLLALSGSPAASTLASCQGDESSWEDPAWGNGAFTEALVAAFQNEKYQDAGGEFFPTKDDNVLTVGELYAYIARRVPQMLLDAGKKATQRPFIPQGQLQQVKEVKMFEVGQR